MTEKAKQSESEQFYRSVNIEFLVHELKNPLTVIEASLSLLKTKLTQQTDLAPLQRRQLQRAQRNCRRMRAMIGSMLEVGRAENQCFACRHFPVAQVVLETLENAVAAYDPELCDSVEALATIAEKTAHLGANGIRLTWSQGLETLEIEQDQTKFEHIVGNLIGNALFFRRSLIMVHLASRGRDLTVAVRDDGPGIAPVHQEMIFERYCQAHGPEGVARSGHGLGLAGARMLAKHLGGHVSVESQLGQGTVFQLQLPMTFTDGRQPEMAGQ